MARSLALLLALLGVTAALAGCTGATERDGPAPPPASEPAPPADPAPAPAPAPRDAPPAPKDFTLQDEGKIEGTFERAWDFEVQNVAFRDAHIHFALASMQAGAPPTARLQLTLFDPQGNPVRTAPVGLGAPSHELSWTFSPGQLAQPGVYRLQAVSAQEAPLPSAGFATYTLDAGVFY